MKTLFNYVRNNKRIRGEIGLVLFLVLIFLIISSLIMAYFEGWGIFNSFYMSIMTLTTIGYGDYTPRTTVGKLISMCIGIVGMPLFLYITTLLITARSQIILNKVERKIELEMDDEINEIKNEIRGLDKKKK